MLTIYKYNINYSIEVPRTATLLKVGYQHGDHMAWYCVDTDEQEFRVDSYIVVATGGDMGDLTKLDYVDTIFDPSGFVWHIYKRPQ